MLNLARGGEDDLAEAVVIGDSPADRPEVGLEIIMADAVKDDRPGCCFGGAIGCPNAVLVQATYAAVADKHHPLGEGLNRTADLHAGHTMADILSRLPAWGHALPDLWAV